MAARTIASASTAAAEDDGGVADGWGDDADLALDDEDKPVGSVGNGESGDEEGGWEVGDEDLELPSDLSTAAHGGDDEDRGYYVPPTRGHPPMQGWAAHSQLAIDHASAGSYESAFRLLNDQIGVVNFSPFKYDYECQLMLSVLSELTCSLSIPGLCLHRLLPSLEPCLLVYPICLPCLHVHSETGERLLLHLKFTDYQRLEFV